MVAIVRLGDNQFASLQISIVGKPSCYINIWNAANARRIKTIHLPARFTKLVHLFGTNILIAMNPTHFCFIHTLTGAIQIQEIAAYVETFLPLRNGSLLIKSENAISVLQVQPTFELNSLPHQHAPGAVIGRSYTVAEEEKIITACLHHNLQNP